MRYQTGHAEETRLQVLAAAAAEIRTHGPNGISVAGIMRRAGLTHGGFYAHFSSKNDLVAEAIDHMFHTAKALSRAMEVDGTDLDRLRAFIRNYVSRHHRDRPDEGCPIAALANDIARQRTRNSHRF